MYHPCGAYGVEMSHDLENLCTQVLYNSKMYGLGAKIEFSSQRVV